MDFRKTAQESTSLSELMSGKTKVDTKDIIREYPDGITITACDLVEYEKNDKIESYPVILFKENPNAFYCGGIVLKKIVTAWVKPFNGDYAVMSDELANSGGCKLKFTEGRTKTGNTITNVEVI